MFLYLCISYLDELSVAGECAVEYLGLYQKLIKPTHWKVYLAARGVLPYIGNLITKVFFYFVFCSRSSLRAGTTFHYSEVLYHLLRC